MKTLCHTHTYKKEREGERERKLGMYNYYSLKKSTIPRKEQGEIYGGSEGGKGKQK